MSGIDQFIINIILLKGKHTGSDRQYRESSGILVPVDPHLPLASHNQGL